MHRKGIDKDNVATLIGNLHRYAPSVSISLHQTILAQTILSSMTALGGGVIIYPVKYSFPHRNIMLLRKNL